MFLLLTILVYIFITNQYLMQFAYTQSINNQQTGVSAHWPLCVRAISYGLLLIIMTRPYYNKTSHSIFGRPSLVLYFIVNSITWLLLKSRTTLIMISVKLFISNLLTEKLFGNELLERLSMFWTIDRPFDCYAPKIKQKFEFLSCCRCSVSSAHLWQWNYKSLRMSNCTFIKNEH